MRSLIYFLIYFLICKTSSVSPKKNNLWQWGRFLLHSIFHSVFLWNDSKGTKEPKNQGTKSINLLPPVILLIPRGISGGPIGSVILSLIPRIWGIIIRLISLWVIILWVVIRCRPSRVVGIIPGVGWRKLLAKNGNNGTSWDALESWYSFLLEKRLRLRLRFGECLRMN